MASNHARTDETVSQPFAYKNCQELFTTAMFFRVILSMKNTLPGIPDAADLSSENIDAHVSLDNFLVWLLGGCSDGNSSTIDRCMSDPSHIQPFLQCGYDSQAHLCKCSDNFQ